jgi:hypothetical protein
MKDNIIFILKKIKKNTEDNAIKKDIDTILKILKYCEVVDSEFFKMIETEYNRG